MVWTCSVSSLAATVSHLLKADEQDREQHAHYWKPKKWKNLAWDNKIAFTVCSPRSAFASPRFASPHLVPLVTDLEPLSLIVP